MLKLCNENAVKSITELCGWDDTVFSLCCLSAEEIESDSWVGVGLALFFLCPPLLGRSAAGAAVGGAQGHTVVLFWVKGLLCCQVTVVGRHNYGFVFLPTVTTSAAPFAPLTVNPPPDPNSPNPGSNLLRSMCVFA